jgi:serpin B
MAHPGLVASRVARETRPSVSAGDIAEVVSANTAAAIDLYHQLAATAGNVFFSPYSIATALTMAASGARGETLAQMLAVLHADHATADLHRAANALNLALLAPRTMPLADGDPLALELANSMWVHAGYHFEPPFLDLLAREYGAALHTVDYQHDAPGAVKAINAWVDTATNHKIRDLLTELDPLTRLVLVNAVHFKASWLTPFAAALTSDGPFTTAAGATVTTPFMHGVVRTGYAAGAGWQAVDLPYVGDASMTVVVPDAGRLRAFEQFLDAAALAPMLGSFRDSLVTLALPKLETKDRIDLRPVLQALGMTAAFTAHAADFSGMTGDRDLHIDQVVHQATITVDEQGTEAAAATGIAVARVSRPAAATLTVDRPYLLLVRDRPTGTILFFGRVCDPMQTETQQP